MREERVVGDLIIYSEVKDVFNYGCDTVKREV